MKNTKVIKFGILLFCLLFNLSNLAAQTETGKIIYTMIKESTPQPKSIDGLTFQNAVVKARLETNDQQSPFHNATGVCENWAVPTGDGSAFVHGVCLFADQDGDTFVTYYTTVRKENNRTIHVKGGTGKFINLEGKGNSFDLGLPDTGKKEDWRMAKWKIKYTL